MKSTTGGEGLHKILTNFADGRGWLKGGGGLH